jgi:L,D-transpeptidase ErfK/SrfK
MAEHLKKQRFPRRRVSLRKGKAFDAKSRPIALIFPIVSLLFFFSLLLDSHATNQDNAPIADQLVGGEFSYVVRSGDSLTGIGARFGVGVNVLAGDNDLSPRSLLKIGQHLRVDNRHIVPNVVSDGIVINIPQRMLFYLKEGRVIRSFPVGLGRYDWPTPTGPFKIVAKEEDPNWDVPISIQDEMQREGKTVKTCVPPGPDNPLGKYWLGLSIAGYGIHSTIAPMSVYQFQTHGCIRAHPDDIAGLFDEVSRGTSGLLVYHRLMMANVDGKIYLEVHRDVYKKETDVRAQFEELLKTLNPEFRVDRELATSIIRKQEGIAREIGVKNSR